MSYRVDRGVPAMECGLGGRMPVPVSGSVFGHHDFAILNADLKVEAPRHVSTSQAGYFQASRSVLASTLPGCSEIVGATQGGSSVDKLMTFQVSRSSHRN